MSGLVYAVLAALLWGGYLFALKHYFEGYSGPVLTVLVNVCALAWYLPSLFLVRDSTRLVGHLLRLSGVEWAVVAGTVAFSAGAFLSLLRALRAGDVSYVAPVSKVVAVFVLPLELLLFGAVLRPTQILGVVVVTAAVYLANYRGGALLEPLRRTTRSRASQFALASAAGYAVSDVGKRVVLQSIGVPTRLWVPLLLAGVGVLLAPVAVRSWPASGLRGDLPKFVLTGGGVAVGVHITTLAFALAPASVASAVVNGQAVVAVLLGGFLLDESHVRIRIVAAALTVCGVALVAL